MKVDLTGKTAIVCGASKGMGFASAKALAVSGANVTILARNNDELKRAEQELIRECASKILTVQCDLSRFEDIKNAFDEAINTFSSVEILVNNTGGPKPGRLDTLSDEDWKSAFESLFLSVVRMTRLSVPIMRQNKFGRIINITSILAKSPSEGMGLSNAIRAAILGFSKTLSREVAKDGITVNSLCPGAIATSRLENLIKLDAKEEKISPEKMRNRMESGIPSGFIATPDDFANAVLFLASPESRYVNGTVIQIDGGEYKGLI